MTEQRSDEPHHPSRARSGGYDRVPEPRSAGADPAGRDSPQSDKPAPHDLLRDHHNLSRRCGPSAVSSSGRCYGQAVAAHTLLSILLARSANRPHLPEARLRHFSSWQQLCFSAGPCRSALSRTRDLVQDGSSRHMDASHVMIGHSRYFVIARRVRLHADRPKRGYRSASPAAAFGGGGKPDSTSYLSARQKEVV